MASIRVLLVDDDVAFARQVRRALSMAEGMFALNTADRLSIAIRSLHAVAFNIVLLDLNLPDSSGLDTLDAIHAANRKLPIVVLTAVDDPGIEEEALKRGAQQFLRKTNLGDLVDTMQRAVGIRLRAPTHQPTKVQPEVESLLNDLDESIKASGQAVSILANPRRDPTERDAVLALRSHIGKMQSRISVFRNDGK